MVVRELFFFSIFQGIFSVNVLYFKKNTNEEFQTVFLGL